MAYESRIYIVNVTGDYNSPYAQPIMEYDLCNMGSNSGFRNLFKEPIDFEIFVDDNTATDTDKYGDRIKEGDLQEVIAWLEAWPDAKTYRRIPPFLAALKAFNPGEWENLKILHYGY